jgi:hypothetical protein
MKDIYELLHINFSQFILKNCNNSGNGKQSFLDVSEKEGLDDRHWRIASNSIDYAADGDQDLYLLNYGPNVFYGNNGNFPAFEPAYVSATGPGIMLNPEMFPGPVEVVYQGIKSRYPEWKYIIDGEGGDENLKGEIVAHGVKSITGLDMPVFQKRRFQHGAASSSVFDNHFPVRENAYRKEFLTQYE